MSKITSHKELSDVEFEKQFSTCVLNRKLFTHEAHIRLTWIHFRKTGLEDASRNVSNQIINYVTDLGAQDKYNATITVAGVKIVWHFLEKSSTENFVEFINENKRLLTDFKGLLLTHYSVDRFNSDEAKKQYVKPDLVPFD